MPAQLARHRSDEPRHAGASARQVRLLPDATILQPSSPAQRFPAVRQRCHGLRTTPRAACWLQTAPRACFFEDGGVAIATGKQVSVRTRYPTFRSYCARRLMICRCSAFFLTVFRQQPSASCGIPAKCLCGKATSTDVPG